MSEELPEYPLPSVISAGPIPADAATPRTDEWMRSTRDFVNTCIPFMRQLERELTQALKERDEWKEKACVLESQVENADVNLEQVKLSLRAQLAAVTQERDKAIRDYNDIFSVAKTVVEDDPDHNPDNLSPEQYGAADGWRLLKRSEVLPNTEWPELTEIELWDDEEWDNSDWSGTMASLTYRTRLSVAELAALRAKGAE